MTTIGDIAVQSFVFAEDIREEKSGKHIIIGATAEGLELTEIPGRVPMALYFELRIPTAGRRTLVVHLAGPGEGTGELNVNLETTRGESVATIYTPKLELLIEREGDLIVSVSCGDSEVREVGRRTFKRSADV